MRAISIPSSPTARADNAGVRDAALLDSCTLDVAVIGKDEAAKAFATKRKPVVVAPH
jgi:hypothetical protein